ncbi:MAG: hypothetical protein ISR82_06500 [Candidatus Marinimicrobia bacterium]|nr:hypothetical protein [Candidatus Neomarinimicrobiota bacterium]MBL7010855.1 hypothetical protein [Candidatus Neomarinimicrobiota bacterium]MBL7031193.1 hypothetical protein [Candidatus Neomarinimicrobiota bacterium]
MPKRAISIVLTLFMAVAIAAPLMHIDCDMPCCEIQKESCCDKKMDGMESCSMSMKKCEHSQFVPIVSGPKSDKKSKNIDYVKSACLLIQPVPECKQETNTAYLHLPPISPAKFNTPLLI